jgi:hypothetical protein
LGAGALDGQCAFGFHVQDLATTRGE